MSYIITAKESHQKNLFIANKINYSRIKNGIEYIYECSYDLPLNESNKDILVTLIKYKEFNIEKIK